MMRGAITIGLTVGLLLGASTVPQSTADASPAVAASEILSSQDLAVTSRFQDVSFGHHKRGRASIAADFNLDGGLDFYIGNPGDESHILLGAQSAGGALRFRQGQVLVTEDLVWGAVASDFDNDGDYDLFLSTGGNEGIGLDYLFQNLFIETGSLRFVDVTATAGVAGPVPSGATEPIPTASAGAVAADYDRDGDTDIFVSTNVSLESVPELLGRNTLWENNGDGTFRDVTEERGLHTTSEKSRHSTFLDFDNDGDADLFENNTSGPSVLWRNQLVESGTPSFEDVTAAMSLPGEDLQYPYEAFASAAADLNNDGWEDLIVFSRGKNHSPPDPYRPGHALFINQGGQGFINIAEATGVNATFIWEHGVMGCQVGDVNADGTPDLFGGNGSPWSGQQNQLFISTNEMGQPPTFVDSSHLIDWPSAEIPGLSYPAYPYRTHGTSIVDTNGDGLNEIAVVNGGPAAYPDTMREPNRLFMFMFDRKPATFTLRPVGNGVTVSRDAIGTRVAMQVADASGTEWTVYRTLFGGSCFSAQNGFDLTFGLGDATTILGLTATWPDGTVQRITGNLEINGSEVLEQSPPSSD